MLGKRGHRVVGEVTVEAVGVGLLDEEAAEEVDRTTQPPPLAHRGARRAVRRSVGRVRGATRRSPATSGGRGEGRRPHRTAGQRTCRTRRAPRADGRGDVDADAVEDEPVDAHIDQTGVLGETSKGLLR